MHKLDTFSINLDIDNNLGIYLLESKDCDLVKSFVQREYEELENKDFFIIGDIDTALPSVFSKNGIIIAAVNNNNEIVAIQAVDNGCEVQNNINPILSSYFTNAHFAEMGWTMTKTNYQNLGLAKNLLRNIEEIAIHKMNNTVFVSTIHPQNVKSLKTYLHLNYIGLTMQSHFGVPRVFLIKEKYKTVHLDFKNILKFSEIEKMESAFGLGYALIDIIIENDKNIYNYAKLI